jgi:hypothetical protein
MRKMKGSVLLQVLLTAVVVCLIAAGMMNLVMLRATAVKRAQQGISGNARAQSYLNAIVQDWSTSQIICHNNTNIGGITGLSVSAGGQASAPGACGCSYTTPDPAPNNTITTCTTSGCTPAAPAGLCGLVISAAPAP